VLPIAVLDVDESSGSGQSPPDPLGLKQSVEPSGDQVPMSASAGAEWGASAPIPPMTPADVSHEGTRERETATDADDTTSATSIRPNSPLHGMLEKTPAVPADTAARTSCASPIAGAERQPSVVESSAAGVAPATAQMISTHETIVGSMTDAGSPGDGGSRDASGPLNVDDAILSPVTHPDVSALVDMSSMQSKSSLPSDGSFEKAPVPANVDASTCGSDNILKPVVPSAQELLPVALIDSGTGGTSIEDPGSSEHIGDANSVGGNDDPKFAVESVESVGSTGPMSIQTEPSTDPIDTGGSAEDLVQTAAVPPFKTPMDAVNHSPSPWKILQGGSDVTSPVSCSTTEGLVGVGDQADTLQHSSVVEDMFLL